MKISCEIELVYLENDGGHGVEGVRATCPVCGHEAEAFGISEASVRRCLVTLHSECPQGKSNFYVASDGSDGN
jgi:hypothetical protein